MAIRGWAEGVIQRVIRYHVVTDDDGWVEQSESRFYNSTHGEQGADFPLTEFSRRHPPA
jgi:hypothetical protein